MSEQPIHIQTACDLIRSLEPGDKIKIRFVNSTFNGDLGGRLLMLLGAFSNTVDFGSDGLGFLTLSAVAESGRWEGYRTYTLTILDGFNAPLFIDRTVNRSLLEGIERVN